MSQFHKWIPVIDEDVCTGCGLCADACGPNCLGIVDGIAMLLCAETCGSEEHCIAVCPEDSIHMQWIPMTGDEQIGKWYCSHEAAGLFDRRQAEATTSNGPTFPKCDDSFSR